jgi:hypothetical protein
MRGCCWDTRDLEGNRNSARLFPQVDADHTIAMGVRIAHQPKHFAIALNNGNRQESQYGQQTVLFAKEIFDVKMKWFICFYVHGTDKH